MVAAMSLASGLIGTVRTRRGSSIVPGALAAVVPVLLGATLLFKRVSQRNWARVAEARSRFTAALRLCSKSTKVPSGQS